MDVPIHYEQSCDVQFESDYVILQHVMVTHPIEVQGFLIFSLEFKKFLAYRIYHSNIPHPVSAQYLVENLVPCTLSVAKRDWPGAGLTKENYGFIPAG